MDSETLEQEIERRRKRAMALGVDRLITRIYYEHGFRNFSLVHASSMKPIFPSVSDVNERERDRLDFRVEGRPYSIRVRERSYDRREGTEVEVFRGEQVVFAQMLSRTRKGMYKTRRVTAFVEGSWLRDFERIDREAEDFRMHRRAAEMAATAAERAKRFGINPANPNQRPSLFARIRALFSS